MKKLNLLMCIVLVAAFLTAGCGSSVSETKPIAEVKQEAQKMDAKQVEGVIAQYKKAIEAKKPKIQRYQAALKAIPLTQIMGEDAVSIRKDIQRHFLYVESYPRPSFYASPRGGILANSLSTMGL